MTPRHWAGAGSAVLLGGLGVYLASADGGPGSWLGAATGVSLAVLLTGVAARAPGAVIAACGLLATAAVVVTVARGGGLDPTTPALAAGIFLACELGVLACETDASAGRHAAARLARRAAVAAILAVAAAGAGLLLLGFAAAPVPAGPATTAIAAAAAVAVCVLLAGLVRDAQKH